jgi:hypothetical protein
LHQKTKVTLQVGQIKALKTHSFELKLEILKHIEKGEGHDEITW